MKAVVCQESSEVTVEQMPSQIFSHELPLDRAYDEFDKRVGGHTKAILKP